jgi:GNAT superfamily N-acetyltransferase
MTDIVIRDADEADVSLLLHFIKSLAVYEKLSHEVTADAELIRRSFFGPRPKVFAMIAEYDGAPAGFAVYFYNYSTFVGKHGIYLEDLYVEPDYRGKGIGKALFMSLARRATYEGCGRMEWSVLDWNTPSIEFYKSLGARPMDDWTIYRLDEAALGRLIENSPS